MKQKILPVDLVIKLFNEIMKPWIEIQRWYLDKPEKISSIQITDYYKMHDTKLKKIYGFLCDIIRSGISSVYFIPLLFIKTGVSELNAPASSVIIDGIEYSVFPAEYNDDYQKRLLTLYAQNKSIITYRGNKAVFTSRQDKIKMFLLSKDVSSKNLLEGSGGTSSNILTDVQSESDHLIVKTIKKAGTDIEMEMYDALSDEKYENMPGYYASAYLSFKNHDQQDGGHNKIPLCLAIQKIKGPSDNNSENWKFKSGYIISDLFIRLLNEYTAVAETDSENSLIDGFLDKNISLTFDNSPAIASKVPSCLTYRNLIKKLGAVIAGFNISLASSKRENFGVEESDMGLVNEKYIIEFVISIEKKIKTLSAGNRIFSGYFNDAVNSIILKSEMILCGLPKIYVSRIHGDMQMDQILFDENFNPVIIDFGGAPVMDVAGKRKRAPAFYDPAGLIRALGYIKFFALKKIYAVTNEFVFESIVNTFRSKTNGNGVKSGNKGESVTVASRFLGIAEEKFSNILIDGYLEQFETRSATGLVMDDWNRNTALMLLEYCTISRALYEINYELSARPSEENALIPLESILLSLI